MRSIRTFGAVVAVALAMVAAILSFSTTSASAAPSAPTVATSRDGYGAIVLSIDGAGGTSRNYPTKAGAYAAATRACKRTSKYPGKCFKAAWVRNQCGAVWFKYNSQGFINTNKGSRPHFGFSPNLKVAEKKARTSHKHEGKIIHTCS